MCSLVIHQIKKGYKVYNIERNIEIISKDVVFHEILFPYQLLKSQNNTNEIRTFFLPEHPETANSNTQNNSVYDSDYSQEYTYDTSTNLDIDVASKQKKYKQKQCNQEL